MAKWYVRNYASDERKFVAVLADHQVINGPSVVVDENAKQLEKVLNRELPEGKVRHRKAKVVS